MNKFETFLNDEQTLSVGGITLENGSAILRLYGAHGFEFTQQGLNELKILAEVINAGVSFMEETQSFCVLPTALSQPQLETLKRNNPFA